MDILLPSSSSSTAFYVLSLLSGLAVMRFLMKPSKSRLLISITMAILQVYLMPKSPFDQLYHASMTGEVASIVQLLQSLDPSVLLGILNQQHAGHENETPLYAACQNGHAEAVKILLSQPGIEVDKTNFAGWTPLFVACSKGHANVVKVLLEDARANVNLALWHQWTPLFMASSRGHHEIVSMLLSNQRDSKDDGTNNHVDVNMPDEKGNSPLLIAAKYGHEIVVRMLLKDARVDAWWRNANGSTILHTASFGGNVEVVKLALTALGAGLEADDYEHKKLEHGEGDVVNVVSNAGATPLLMASRVGHVGVVQLLLHQIGIDAKKADRNGTTPFFAACAHGHELVVEALLVHSGADDKHSDDYGDKVGIWEAHPERNTTGFCAAAHAGYLGVVTRMLISDNVLPGDVVSANEKCKPLPRDTGRDPKNKKRARAMTPHEEWLEYSGSWMLVAPDENDERYGKLMPDPEMFLPIKELVGRYLEDPERRRRT